MGVLVNDGPEKFADALGKTEEVESIRFPGQNTRFPSVRLHLARQFQDGDKRMINLATPRPLGYLEVVRQDRSLDYSLTMLSIEFDGDADGSGPFIVGAEVVIDPETHKLQIETGSTAPATVSQMKRRN